MSVYPKVGAVVDSSRRMADACVVCGYHPSRLLFRMGFGSISRCSFCGTVFRDPIPSAEELVRLHSTAEYFSHKYFEARRDPSTPGSISRSQRVLAQLAAYVRAGRLLDVGCDTGTFLLHARDLGGYEVVGLDVSSLAAAYARDRHNLNVQTGRLGEIRFEAASFDVVTAIDLIEHLPNPSAFLAEVRRILRPGGVLYLTTLNHDALVYRFACLLGQLADRSAPLLDRLYVPFHVFYFGTTQLSRLIGGAGFAVLHHRRKEFPLEDLQDGLLVRLGLRALFAVQTVIRRQTLQEMIAQPRQGAESP